jgi:hypothetical protein
MRSREERRQDENDRFGDLVYDAWRDGRDSDAVSRDRLDDRLAQGYYPDEVSLDMVLPRQQKQEEQEEQVEPTPQEQQEGDNDV